MEQSQLRKNLIKKAWQIKSSPLCCYSLYSLSAIPWLQYSSRKHCKWRLPIPSIPYQNVALVSARWKISFPPMLSPDIENWCIPARHRNWKVCWVIPLKVCTNFLDLVEIQLFAIPMCWFGALALYIIQWCQFNAWRGLRVLPHDVSSHIE